MRALLVSALLTSIGCVGPSLMGQEQSSNSDLAMPMTGPVAEQWLPDAIGYEIFVRSFADSNGDGNGDLS